MNFGKTSAIYNIIAHQFAAREHDSRLRVWFAAARAPAAFYRQGIGRSEATSAQSSSCIGFEQNFGGNAL